MHRQMLSKEEEATAEEVPVRREDQEKINKFSRLHQRESGIEQDLKQRRKEKDDLEEISTELELIDLEDDERIPYKIGDSFFSLTSDEVQECLSKLTGQIDEKIGKLEAALGDIREEMNSLKVVLYGRFGRSINLEI